MSVGGLTGDKHQEHSTEYYEIGSDRRTIAYGRTREEVIEHLSQSDPRSNWDEKWVVMPTRTIKMGLGSQWARVPRGLDREYHMV